MRTYGKINASPQNEFVLDEQHVPDKQPLLPARLRESERGAPDHRGPVPFTIAHETAADRVYNIALGSLRKAAEPRMPLAPVTYADNHPSRLLSPLTLSAVSDLLDIRYDGPELQQRHALRTKSRAFAADAIHLMAALVTDGRLDAQNVMSAIKQPPPGDAGKPPFLLAVASAAMHDRSVAAAMCELLEAVAPHVNADSPGQLARELLELDSPYGARSPKERPEDLDKKYTNFFGRLIGDGRGELGNDGAVLAIGRLSDAGLLPSKQQVKAHRSRRRWGKQEHFVDMCRTLRTLPPWRDDRALDRPSLKQIEDRLRHFVDQLCISRASPGDASGHWANRALATQAGKTASADASIAQGEYREQVEQAVEKCVAEVLQERWKDAEEAARDRMVARIFVNEFMQPAFEDPKSAPALCLPGMARLPRMPPAHVVDQVTERVFEDREFRASFYRAKINGVQPSFETVLKRDVGAAADAVLKGLLKRLDDIEIATSPAPQGESRGSMKRR